jgi:hypothetical protein
VYNIYINFVEQTNADKSVPFNRKLIKVDTEMSEKNIKKTKKKEIIEKMVISPINQYIFRTFIRKNGTTILYKIV